MPSTFSQSLRIELIGAGEQSGTWNITTNNNLGSLIEQAISGNTSLDVTGGDITLTALNGVVDQSRSAVLSVSGTPGTTRVLTIPNVTKLYTVRNASDSTVQIKTASGVAYSVPAAAQANIFCDGNNVITGRTITDGAQALLNSQTPFNNVALTGVPTAPTAPYGTNTTQIATTAFVQAALPAGVIVMWSGSIASIPAGWALCNGAAGTPDLRDRFIVGAGSSYAVGATGGATSVTLSVNNLPSHTHTGTTAATSIAHTHTFSATTGGAGGHSHTGSGTTSSTNVDHTHSGTTGGQSNDHSHSGTTGSENQNHTHSGTTDGVGNHSHSLINGAALFRVNAGGSWFTGSSGSLSYGEFGNTNDAGAHAHGFTTSGVSNGHTHNFGTGGVSANHTHNITTGGMSANAAHTHTYSFTTSTQADHTHTVSGTSGSTDPTHSHTFTTNATGSGAAFNILPPYYALAYIMKT